MDFQESSGLPRSRVAWMEALYQSRPATVARLARRVESLVHFEVTRPPAQSLLLVAVEESVEGNPFYPGELLVSTCEVRLADRLGFGICLGGDLERARGCAILDAALQAGLPVASEILQSLTEEREWLLRSRHAEQEMVHSTRVRFDTMEPQR